MAGADLFVVRDAVGDSASVAAVAIGSQVMQFNYRYYSGPLLLGTTVADCYCYRRS